MELESYQLLARNGTVTVMRGEMTNPKTRVPPPRHLLAWSWWNRVRNEVPTLFRLLAKTCALASPSVG
jgi:hypothetical protein